VNNIVARSIIATSTVARLSLLKVAATSSPRVPRAAAVSSWTSSRTSDRSRATRPSEPRHCPCASHTVSPSGNRGVTCCRRKVRHSSSLTRPLGRVRPKQSVVRTWAVPAGPHGEKVGWTDVA